MCKSTTIADRIATITDKIMCKYMCNICVITLL